MDNESTELPGKLRKLRTLVSADAQRLVRTSRERSTRPTPRPALQDDVPILSHLARPPRLSVPQQGPSASISGAADHQVLQSATIDGHAKQLVAQINIRLRASGMQLSAEVKREVHQIVTTNLAKWADKLPDHS